MHNDVLSNILEQIQLEGGVHFRCELGSPWGMTMPGSGEAEFHVVTRGNCWLHMPELPSPIPLQGGDLLVFPHGDAHMLSNAADNLHATPVQEIASDNLSGYGPVIHGGPGAPAHLLCGYFRFDRERPHPLIKSLPRVIHIRNSDGHDLEWLKTTLHFMSMETYLSRPGAGAILNGLAKVLFVQLIRAYTTQSGLTAGLLAAIADNKLSKALDGIHNDPGKHWSLASLASQAGMSRSAFAERFQHLVGTTALQYLTELRMRLACELLANSYVALADIAGRTGYSSEAAFSKAFKRVHGLSPGAWRKQVRLANPVAE